MTNTKITLNENEIPIRVFLRRKKALNKLLKEVIINKGLTQKLLPHKTTRHFLRYRPRNININLANFYK